MGTPTLDELFAAARGADLASLGEQRAAVQAAVYDLAARHEGRLALELASLAWRVWFSRGELGAGRAVLRAALEAPDAQEASAVRAHVLYADGVFAFRQGDQQTSSARNQEALAVARAVSDATGECNALVGLARVALREGEYARVIELARNARQVAQASGDRIAETGALHLLAAGTRLDGDYKLARELYTRSLELNRELGRTSWVGMELHNLGWVDLHLGDAEAATRWFSQRNDQETEPDAYGRAWNDLDWAGVALLRGDGDEARNRFAVGNAALTAAGLALDPDDEFELSWLDQQLKRL